MKSSFLKRIFRAIKIDPELYEEVEHDKSATFQAAAVVVLSSLAAGVGAIHLGVSNFIFGPIISLASCLIEISTGLPRLIGPQKSSLSIINRIPDIKSST